MVIAQNDPVRPENALAYYLELTKNKVPSELHIYPNGGHGYGLRESKEVVTTWPARAIGLDEGETLIARRELVTC
jgi:acetyl esterase/lipase